MASLFGGAIKPAIALANRDEASSSGQGTKRRRGLPSLGMGGGSCAKRRAVGATPQARKASEDKSAMLAITTTEPLPFSVLADGPYFDVASWLDAPDLARTDVACRLLHQLNSQPFGPWQSLGHAAFFGMELDVGGGFLPFDGDSALKNRLDRNRQDWKSRYKLFDTEVPTFSSPFSGKEITAVDHPDEVAYCRCRLRTDLLATRSDRGVYVEVEIRANADNLSLAVVDFEGGGCSSVTFSPETGAVLRERKVRESPRAIEGTYIHLLPAAAPGHRFEGVMGIFLQNGQLAFFRRWFAAPATTAVSDDDDVEMQEDAALNVLGADGASASTTAVVPAASAANSTSAVEPQWETTGFCTDLTWASGQRLSLCLAFRDDGEYKVQIARVGRTPPIPPHKSEAAYQDAKWNHLYGDDDHPLAI